MDSVSSKKRTLTTGALCFSTATFISKLASFGAQIVLAWYLTSEDFGVFAIALSLAAWVTVLRNGGADQILIQRGSEYTTLAGKILTFSLLFNFLALILLAVISLVAAYIYDQEVLVIVMVTIGVSYLITSQAMVLKSKLAIDQRYQALSSVAAFADIGRQAGAVMLAISTGSVLSLAIPVAVEPILAMIAAYWVLRSFQKPRKITLTFFRGMLLDTRWVMISNLALALILTGVYFVASWFISTSEVGIFFFAFQLIMSVAVLITNSINNIVFPYFSNSVTTEIFRRYAAKGISLCLLVGGLMTGVLLFILDPLISTLWQGKWDNAIPIAEILSLAVPFILTNTLVFSVLAAKGFWVFRCACISIIAFLDLFSVGLGAYFGGLHAAVACLALAKLLGTFVILVLVWKRIFMGKVLFRNWAIDIALVASMMATFFYSPDQLYLIAFSFSTVFALRAIRMTRKGGVV